LQFRIMALLDTGDKPRYHPLAATLRRLAEAEKIASGSRERKIHAARDRFYKGDIADELDAFYRRSGAFLRKSDLSAYTTKIEKPVTVNYRGYSVSKCNTWTQGPVLLQSLNLISHFDVRSMGFFSPDQVSLTVEAMKLAFADRDKYYCDPAFINVPLDELLSDRYT
jgi:gamma-glutamyltranspeptidase / glutathione hydrolase